MLLSIISYLLGGTGLFLVGMILMSDGLRSAAGGALQRILERSTRTPFSGFLTGIGMTAVVQSSSATTVATIGFVSAGLLSFTSTIGVIIGANVGTTSTGWIVSMLGFKVDVALMALPLIGIGALMRLLAGGRRAQFGMALVGFGLIFVGIEFLQEGMGGLAERIDLSRFSAEATGGRVALVILGTMMTVLLQSSSAAVAVTLTALDSGAVDLEQSAYLVIGQNLGTTVTAVLASAGASIPARRTAAVHIMFNVASALLAFVFARYLLDLAQLIAGERSDSAVQIALFHTIFNVSGAVLVLPFTSPFARLVTRIVPESGPHLTRHLDRSLLAIPDVAVEAAYRAMKETAAVTLSEARLLLVGDDRDRMQAERVRNVQSALQTTVDFLSSVEPGNTEGTLQERRLSLFHVSDHLARLIEAYLEADVSIYGDDARDAAGRVIPAFETALEWLRGADRDPLDVARRAEEVSKEQAEVRREHRAELLKKTAAGTLPPGEAHRQLESMRWIDRVVYHAWRALHHLAGATDASEPGNEVYVGAETEKSESVRNGR